MATKAQTHEYRPTFAGYSENRLKQLLSTLDPHDHNDRLIKADIERRLSTLRE